MPIYTSVKNAVRRLFNMVSSRENQPNEPQDTSRSETDQTRDGFGRFCKPSNMGSRLNPHHYANQPRSSNGRFCQFESTSSVCASHAACVAQSSVPPAPQGKQNIVKQHFLSLSVRHIPQDKFVFVGSLDRAPQIGDVVYGKVVSVAYPPKIETTDGYQENLETGEKIVFVCGERYAPDALEGLLPKSFDNNVDLFCRAGLVGDTKSINTNKGSCTKVQIIGHVFDKEEKALNTLDFPKIALIEKGQKRQCQSNMIVIIGSAMDSGKSTASAACCLALSREQKSANAFKVSGTAGFRDINLAQQNGAHRVADFSWLGYPSTYRLAKKQLLDIFRSLDYEYGSEEGGYIVVEISDGIFQRETRMLLSAPEVRNRIHRLVYCAKDTAGIFGGLAMLKETFGLQPDLLSGVCSSAPLAVGEIQKFTNIPCFDSKAIDNETVGTTAKLLL